MNDSLKDNTKQLNKFESVSKSLEFKFIETQQRVSELSRNLDYSQKKQQEHDLEALNLKQIGLSI